MKITAFQIDSTEFPVDDTYHQIKAEGRIEDEFDYRLSDMDGETILIEEDGTEVQLYGNTTSLFDLVRPILDRLPTWQIDQYAAERRAVEE